MEAEKGLRRESLPRVRQFLTEFEEWVTVIGGFIGKGTLYREAVQ